MVRCYFFFANYIGSRLNRYILTTADKKFIDDKENEYSGGDLT